MRAEQRMIAACCTCGAAVWHHRTIVDGFLADHQPGRRPGCTATAVLEDAESIDDVFALLRPPVEVAGQLDLFGAAS